MTGPNETENRAKSADDKGGKLDNRLEKLDAELSRLKEDRATDLQKQSQQQSGASSLALAWRLGSEFIAGVLVGGGVGFLIDTWFGLAPWGLIIFLLLGFLAGMLNMLRSAGKIPPPGA